ncbi:glycoside hydrolase family 18 protein [Bacillus sp. DNRA2]|uniref:glycoside hydrolase family 18 protein n=1 Tax=Bacillus sp. DNRA2 TaxID=2723053 RepID=UPI00145C9143|nr:glycoside hydrolase family 18 protein [Bacillus sp. DNRA2]NMD70450.1 glycoside hydrolase family 18 protein [Bacillus sp. DNRA2]
MKRRILLLIILTFIGVFFARGFFETKIEKHKVLNVSNNPLSQKKLQHKEALSWKPEQQKVLIGYVQDFRSPDSIDYQAFSHLIFSFAHPTKDGSFILNGDQALTNLRSVVSKAKSSHTKVLLAVGGWFHLQGGEAYPYFQSAISNDSTRSRLVEELIKIVEAEQLDGIDVDFEHPRTVQDAENLEQFIKQLSDQLHPLNKQVTVAVHAKIHAGTLTEAHFVKYAPEMFKYVDYVNIMAYDGQWDGGYNAANLSPLPFTEKIVSYWSNLFQSLKLPTERLILGVPSYAQPEDPATKQLSYQTLLEYDPANANRDSTFINGTTYHYNSDATIQRKTSLALSSGFGGMMLWEVGLDAKGSQSLTSAIFEVLENT